MSGNDIVSFFFAQEKNMKERARYFKKFDKVLCFGQNIENDEFVVYDIQLLYNFLSNKANSIIDLCENMNINCELLKEANCNIDFIECKRMIQRERAVLKSYEIAKINTEKFDYRALFINEQFLSNLYKSKALICLMLFERLSSGIIKDYKENYFKLIKIWRQNSGLSFNKNVTPFDNDTKKIQQELV